MAHENQENFPNPLTLEVQMEAVGAALERFESTIGDVSEFSSENAINLGMQYILRDIQYSELAIQHAEITGDSESAEKAKTDLLVQKVIIDSGRKGIYTPAQSFFQKLGNWQLQVADVLKRIEQEQGADMSAEVAEWKKQVRHISDWLRHYLTKAFRFLNNPLKLYQNSRYRIKSGCLYLTKQRPRAYHYSIVRFSLK